MSNKQLVEELPKQIIRKFEKHKAYSSFKDNIWVADSGDMQLISHYNKGIRFVLCVNDINNKYSWVVSLKDKKSITNTEAFQKVLHEFGCNTNIICVNKGIKFYNRSLNSWLQDNNIEMYSIHNEGKFVAAKRFIRTLNNKTYEYMTAISKNVYNDKLNDIVNGYINTYHTEIKVKVININLLT